MMNIIKDILIFSTLVLSFGAISNIAVAIDVQTGMTQPINNTIAPLEAALSAVNANDFEEAQKHITAARQASKEITGSTVAPKASRASDAIVKARRYVKEGNAEKAAGALKEALLIFNSIMLHRPSDARSLGGL